MRIYITGLPYTGTTFLLNLYVNAGFNAGNPVHLSNGLGTRHGGEYKPFLSICSELSKRMGIDSTESYWQKYTSEFEEYDFYKEAFKNMVAGIPENLEVLKCPDLGQHIFYDLFVFDYCIVTKRGFIQWFNSLKRNKLRVKADTLNTFAVHNSYLYGLHLITDNLQKAGKRFIVIDYPEILRSFHRLWKTLEPTLKDRVSEEDFYKAFCKTIRYEWVSEFN